MTVSRVVNKEDNVRPSTREAVNRAIKELGYRPNKAARSLASANPMTVGLVYINPNNSYFSAMMRGLLDRARHADTHVIIEECEEGPDTLRTIIEMYENGVDGFILGPPLCDAKDTLEMLQKKRIPAVTIGARHEFEMISAVSIDDWKAANELTAFLVSLGHRRIAYVIGNPGQSASWLRLEGYKAALLDAGLEIDDELIIQGRFAYRSGSEAADILLDLDDRPTAIIACNDDMAAGAVAAAHHRNIGVPDELTICGFDDTMLATAIEPEITTIRQPIAEMAHEAVELLERNIRAVRSGNDYKGLVDVLDFELVLRGSHAPPPGA